MFVGSRENRDPDWEGSDASNRKHDPAVLRLYLASVAMCCERTLQTLRTPSTFGPLTHVSVDFPRRYSHTSHTWSGGVTDACDVIDLKGSTATPEFSPRPPRAAARLGRHVQHTRVVVQAAARTDVVSASWSLSRPVPLLQLLPSSASVLLIKDPSVSHWRQLRTQSVQKQAKKPTSTWKHT